MMALLVCPALKLTLAPPLTPTVLRMEDSQSAVPLVLVTVPSMSVTPLAIAPAGTATPLTMALVALLTLAVSTSGAPATTEPLETASSTASATWMETGAEAAPARFASPA
ncbi:hypothetical protein ACAN107058_14665 [Paracidovorax anthurii]